MKARRGTPSQEDSWGDKLLGDHVDLHEEMPTIDSFGNGIHIRTPGALGQLGHLLENAFDLFHDPTRGHQGILGTGDQRGPARE
jgi:hypothetical protein